jgi:uncharacterized protein YciI
MLRHYVVHLSHKQKHLLSEQLLRDHVAYLRSLSLKGVLPFCGPCADGTALMIVRANSLEEAQELIGKDPFSQVDYYQKRKLVEIEAATLENNFLLDEVDIPLERKE